MIVFTHTTTQAPRMHAHVDARIQVQSPDVGYIDTFVCDARLRAYMRQPTPAV